MTTLNKKSSLPKVSRKSLLESIKNRHKNIPFKLQSNSPLKDILTLNIEKLPTKVFAKKKSLTTVKKIDHQTTVTFNKNSNGTQFRKSNH